METNNMSLYKLDETMRLLIEQGLVYDEETGEVFFTSDDIDALQMSIDDKINNIIGYIKQLDIEADNYETIKKEYDTRAKQKKSRANSLKKYLDSFMTSNNIPKKETVNGIAKYTKSTICEITDPTKIIKFVQEHEEYKDKFIKAYEPEISKTAIKDYLKEGNELDGAILITKQNLNVK